MWLWKEVFVKSPVLALPPPTVLKFLASEQNWMTLAKMNLREYTHTKTKI
jgi:hypothetical protein